MFLSIIITLTKTVLQGKCVLLELALVNKIPRIRPMAFKASRDTSVTMERESIYITITNRLLAVVTLSIIMTQFVVQTKGPISKNAC